MVFPPSDLSADNILRDIHDTANQRIRVDAVVSATIADVIINAEESDIAIKDRVSGYLLKVESDGSIDVNTVISAATDSIKISDGTDVMEINADGSINVAGVVSGTVTTDINGLANIATTQYTVGLSAIQLTPTPLSGRKSISIKVVTTSNSDAVYVGNTSGVTTSTGYPLFNGDSLQIDLTDANFLYVIGTSANQLVYVLELG